MKKVTQVSKHFCVIITWTAADKLCTLNKHFSMYNTLSASNIMPADR